MNPESHSLSMLIIGHGVGWLALSVVSFDADLISRLGKRNEENILCMIAEELSAIEDRFSALTVSHSASSPAKLLCLRGGQLNLFSGLTVNYKRGGGEAVESVMGNFVFHMRLTSCWLR